MHGISRYCHNVLEVLSVELRPYNPGLGQGLKVIYFKPQNKEPWPRPGLPGLNDRRPDMVQQYKQVQAQRVSRQGGPQNIEVKNIVLFL